MTTGELLQELEEQKPSAEPAIKVGSAVTTVAGLLSLALYFFPNISPSLIQAVLVVSAFILPIITALFTRGKVWSPDSVQEVVDAAVKNALAQANQGKTLPLRTATKYTPEEDPKNL